MILQMWLKGLSSMSHCISQTFAKHQTFTMPGLKLRGDDIPLLKKKMTRSIFYCKTTICLTIPFRLISCVCNCQCAINFIQQCRATLPCFISEWIYWWTNRVSKWFNQWPLTAGHKIQGAWLNPHLGGADG